MEQVDETLSHRGEFCIIFSLNGYLTHKRRLSGLEYCLIWTQATAPEGCWEARGPSRRACIRVHIRFNIPRPSLPRQDRKWRLGPQRLVRGLCTVRRQDCCTQDLVRL